MFRNIYGLQVRIPTLTASKFTRRLLTSRSPFDPKKTFTWTESPAPAWKIGDGSSSNTSLQKGDKRKTWDLTNPDVSQRDTYRLLTSVIVPRPIAFVSSISNDGIPNLAPFSYFSMVSHNPPMISISFNLSSRRPKDTRENILQTKEFTVNIISESFISAANSTSVESPAEVDEWVLSGLTMEPSTGVKPALVNESSVGMECELYNSQDICAPGSSNVSTTVVLGTIKKVHVKERILDDDCISVDPAKLGAVGRLGGNTYSRVLDVFDIGRISWKSVVGEYEALKAKK